MRLYVLVDHPDQKDNDSDVIHGITNNVDVVQAWIRTPNHFYYNTADYNIATVHGGITEFFEEDDRTDEAVA